MVMIQIHSDAEKARKSHICIIGNAFGKPISTNLKVINFYEEFALGFLASNCAVVQSTRKLTFVKAELYVPSFVRAPGTWGR